MDSPYISIISNENKDFLAVGEMSNNDDIKHKFEIYINLSPESLNFSEKYIYIFSIKNNDLILFNCIEFIFNLVVTKKTVFVFGNKKTVHIFICCFLRRWYKYSFQKSLEMTEVFYMVKYNSKLNFNNFEIRQIERYNPPVVILICGDKDTSREFDLILEKEIRCLPKKSMVYIGDCGGICKRTVEICKRLNIEYEIISLSADSIFSNGVEMILAFHEDIEFSKNLFSLIKIAKEKNIDVFLFDLKNKQKL